MTELYPPQKAAVEKLVEALRRLRVAGNWSVTGTGKTLVGLTVAKNLDLQPLVVAPLAAHGTWAAWSRDLGVPVVGIANPERLKTGKLPWVTSTGKGKAMQFRWNLKTGGNGHIVLWDEIHRGMLGQDSQTGRMAAMLRPQGIPVLLMSATPFTSPLDMRNSGYLLGLHKYASADYWRFCRAHGCRNSPFHRGLDFNPESRLAKVHLSRIREFLDDRTVRLTVEDLKEFFPEQIVEPTLISLQDRETREIDELYAEMSKEVRETKNPNPLVEMLRARQRAEYLSAPAISDMVVDSLAEGNSVFVACSFKDTLARIRLELLRQGVLGISVLTGDSSPAEREAAVKLFQLDKHQVFLATMGAGGLSISLHRTREEQRPRTSIVRPTFKADELIQCLGRIYRAGGMGNVVQRIVLVAGTVEERVYRRLQFKINNIATLTDDDLA